MELTDRCNLKCEHCFTGRHGGNDDLSLEVLGKVLDEARDHGFEHITFTGGDPTVHAKFPEVVRQTAEAGYRYSFVTNGWNFTTIYPRIAAYRDRLSVVTFSMDGATQETHDRLRGKNSFLRVLKAIAYCTGESIPFTINMVVTAHNRGELGEMAELATQLGSRGLRFGHLMPNFLTTVQGFDLSPWERKLVEAEIQELRRSYPIKIGMAPGFHTTDLFPCAPLNMQELNIDHEGNLSKCCHLSSHGDGVGDGDVMGDLREVSFSEAYGRLEEENRQFQQNKLRHMAGGEFKDTDFFPCWYCSLYYRKVDWLRRFKDHSWTPVMWESDQANSDHGLHDRGRQQPAPVKVWSA